MRAVKRSIAIILFIIPLLLGMFFVLPFSRVQAEEEPSYLTPVDTSKLDGTNWMSQISGFRLLTEINLPGTHDSGTRKVESADAIVNSRGEKYAVCQFLSIADQLNAGVRYFDIRLSPDYDTRTSLFEFLTRFDRVNLWNVHGDWQWGGRINGRFFAKDENGKHINLYQILDTICAFLEAHPTEAVIVSTSMETYYFPEAKAAYPDLIKQHMALYERKTNPKTQKPFLFDARQTGATGDKERDVIPKLQDCRGQFVLLTDNRASIGGEYGSSYSGSRNSGTQEEAAFSPTMRLGDQITNFENHYEAKDKQKKTWINSFYEKFGTKRIPINPNERLGFANFLQSSSNVYRSQTPREIADEVNPMMYGNDSFFKRGNYYGWVISDFVTADTAKKVWISNYPEHIHKMEYKGEKAATCEESGTKLHYECTECHKKYKDRNGEKEITNMDDLRIPATGHKAGEPVIENNVPAAPGQAGSYDKVSYCSVCKKEVNRETISVPAGSEGAVPYIDDFGVVHFCNDYIDIATLTEQSGWGLEDGKWYVVKNSRAFQNFRLTVRGNVNLILGDGAELTLGKGIRLEKGKNAALTIWCQEGKSGTLTATGAEGTAGIGGDASEAGGRVIVHGGIISAVGGMNGAGIGGGNSANGGSFILYGGVVTARGGENGAGIGGGNGGNQGSREDAVIIFSGEITANGGKNGAGIGGGNGLVSDSIVGIIGGNNIIIGADGGRVEISGGIVNANGGESAAGIGGGNRGKQGGSVTITGGNTTSTGGYDGAGIGGGKGGGYGAIPWNFLYGGKGGDVTISGGNVKAVGQGKAGGIGNGRGSYGADEGSYDDQMHALTDQIDLNGTLSITGGTLTAIGGDALFPHQRTPQNRFSHATKIGTLSSAALTVAAVKPLPDHYSVTVGDDRKDQSDGNYVIRYGTARTEEARRNRWAYITVCSHEKGGYNITENGHMLYCMYCNTDLSGEEPHHFNGSQENICIECGYQRKTFDVGYQFDDTAPEETATRKFEAYYGQIVALPDYEVLFDGDIPEARKNSGDYFESWLLNGKEYYPGDEVTLYKETIFLPKFGHSWKPLQDEINNHISAGRKDVTVSKNWTAGKKDSPILIPKGAKIILDLAGSVIDRGLSEAKENGSVFVVEGDLTIIDSRGGGKITGGNSSDGAGGIFVKEGGSLHLQAGLVTGNQSPAGSAAIVAEEDSSLSVSGTVQVTGNKAGSTEANILLKNGVKIRIPQKLEESAKLGISLPPSEEKEISAIVTDGAKENAREASFISDGEGLLFGRNEKGEIILGTPVTIHFSPGTEEVTNVIEDIKLAKGSSCVLSKGYTAKANKAFLSFSDGQNSYSVGESVTVQGNMNLTAQWGFSVSFDANGGTGTMAPAVASETADYYIPECSFTAPEGKMFAGWKASSGSEQLLFPGSALRAKENITLTAQWGEAFHLWVGDTKVTYENNKDILGDGTASFDPLSGTLTLKGLKPLTSAHLNSLIYAENMILFLEGSGSVIPEGIAPYKGIHVSKGSLFIKGDITAQALNYGIYADNVIVSGGKLNASATAEAGVGIRAFGTGGTIQIRGMAEVEAKGSRAVLATNSILLDDDLYVKTPENGVVNNRSINGTDGRTAPHVLIANIPAHTHSLALVKEKSAGCTEDGRKAHYKCSTCEKLFADPEGKQEVKEQDLVLKAKGHTPADAVKEKEVAATCEKAGSFDKVVYCSVCRQELSRENKTVDALGHDWGEWEANEPLTCEEDAVFTRVCSRDGSHKETETIKAEGHIPADPVKENEKEATCEEEGTYDLATYCAICDQELSRDTIKTPATGHDFEEGELTREPTCTVEGEATFTCINCDKTEKILLEPYGHAAADEAEITVIREATCIRTGRYLWALKCRYCGEMLTSRAVETEAPGHQFGEWTETPATCESNGTRARTCSVCHITETEILPAKGHDWGEWSITEDGKKERVCRNDPSHKETKVIPAEDHVHGLKHYPAAKEGCETAGNLEFWMCEEGEDPCGGFYRRCKNQTDPEEKDAFAIQDPEDESKQIWLTECQVEDVVLTAKGHQWGEWETVTEASCTEAGSAQRVCEHDPSHVETKEIPAKGHEALEITIENEVAATCTESGTQDEVIRCTRCQEELLRLPSVTTSPLGHDWDEGTITKPASCTEEGKMLCTCKRDSSHTKEVGIPAKGHSAGETEVAVITKATCERQGVERHDTKCANCGETLTSVVVSIPKLEHKWGDWTVAEKATCEEPGYEKHICENDASHVEYRILPATGHVPGEPVRENERKATCEEDGSFEEAVYCTVCNEELFRTWNEIEAPGHDWGEILYTWSEDGLEATAEISCQRCGEKETETVKAVIEITKQPTDKEDGERVLLAEFTTPGFETLIRTEAIPAYGNLYYLASEDRIGWQKGSNTAAEFIFKRLSEDETTFGHFTGLLIDGREADPSAYKAAAGSVVISLLPEYLERLSAGEHTVTAQFDDGSAFASFVIKEQQPAKDDQKESGNTGGMSPQTNDSQVPYFWGGLFLAALLLIAVTILLYRKT